MPPPGPTPEPDWVSPPIVWRDTWCLGIESLEWIKRWCFDHLVSEDRRLAEAYHGRTAPSGAHNL